MTYPILSILWFVKVARRQLFLKGAPYKSQIILELVGLTYSFQTDYTEANHLMIDLSVCMHMSTYGMYVVYVCVYI